jgi:hypothetical protein
MGPTGGRPVLARTIPMDAADQVNASIDQAEATRQPKMEVQT